MFGPLLYTAYYTHRTYTAPIYASAAVAAKACRALPPGVQVRKPVRRLLALHQVLSGAKLTHRRPDFGIDEVVVDGKAIAVTEHAVDSTPFATLTHFAKDTANAGPPVLLIAPMSGHFATILTPTVKTLLRDHDVYITDWHNAREVPVSKGPFGLDEYVDQLLRFIRFLGPNSHVVAVCQPCVPALMAASVLAAADDPCQPRTLTLMSGPIDTRLSPSKLNETAGHHPLSWFRSQCVTKVPPGPLGAGRRVFPGFLQITGFLAMNPGRHWGSHFGMYRELVEGKDIAAVPTKAFYAEYFAVCDIAEEFYLDTVSKVFQRHLLPRGKMDYHGELIDPGAIRKTALLTVEAELDDMCGPGQTAAAHELCTSLSDQQRGRYVQPGVGHYGVFAGSRWDGEIYPVVRDFIAEHQPAGKDL